MNYDLLVLDVDGTLRAKSAPCVSDAVVAAVKAVQKAGVRVALGTGRCRVAVHESMMNGLKPDYYICANGGQVLDRAGELLYSDTMTAQEMYALVDFFEDHERPLAFSFADGYYAYLDYAQMAAFYSRATGGGVQVMRDGEDQDHHLICMPYCAFGILPEEDEEKFRAKYDYMGLKFMAYDGCHYDIARAGQDKAVGLQKLCEALNLPLDRVVAVGDGTNDAGMLRAAGLGVAMADGRPAALAAAQRTCPGAGEDGVAALCRELFPQAFGESRG